MQVRAKMDNKVDIVVDKIHGGCQHHDFGRRMHDLGYSSFKQPPVPLSSGELTRMVDSNDEKIEITDEMLAGAGRILIQEHGGFRPSVAHGGFRRHTGDSLPHSQSCARSATTRSTRSSVRDRPPTLLPRPDVGL